MPIPSLGVEQCQYEDDGVLLNGDAPVPFFDIERVSGLDNAPVKAQQIDREGTDGGYVDAEFEGIRTVTVEGTIYAPVTNMETYLDSLKVNFAPRQTNRPFYFMTDAGLRVVFGKSLGCNYSKESIRRTGRSSAQIQILCEDSRIYSPHPVTRDVSLVSTPVAGRGYDKGYAFGYGAVASESSLVFPLTGNRDTVGTLRIDGAITNPSIVNDTAGSTFSFNYMFDAGDFVTVDLYSKSVLLNGITSIRDKMSVSGGWYHLHPGDTSFRLLGTQSPPTPAGKLTVTAYPAYR